MTVPDALRYAPVGDEDRERVERFIAERWMTATMVLRGEAVDLTRAEGVAVWRGVELVALLTHRALGDALEILSLDSLIEGRGIGSELIRRAVALAGERGHRRVVVVTTNDNVEAIRFYQRRGFDLTCLRRDALDAARRLKPEIPLVGEHGIPLRHELELELALPSRLPGEGADAQAFWARPIALADVTADTWEAVCMLHPGEAGRAFVASNAFSIAQSVYEPCWTIKRILLGDTLIGFAMYGMDEDGRPDLCRFMLDRRYQGKGCGRRALAAVTEEMKRLYPGRDLYLSTSPLNERGRRLYLSFGFVPTGEVDGEGDDAEDVFRLPVAAGEGERHE